MKYFANLFLFCSWSLLSAEPIVDAELAKEVPGQEISKLVTLSEELFEKKIESLEYIYRDEPPAGDSAVIVRFRSEQESSTVEVFPAAFFHYLPWSNDDDLPLHKKKVVQGKWASDGKLQITKKYHCTLSGRTFYIAFRPEVTYDEAIKLLRVIDTDDYDFDFNTGSERWDQWLRSAAQKEFRVLKVETIFHLGVTHERGERRLVVNVNDSKGGLSLWTFAMRESRYVLLAIMPYAI